MNILFKIPLQKALKIQRINQTIHYLMKKDKDHIKLMEMFNVARQELGGAERGPTRN